ncbi:MAG: endonuclease/exonuclease/phosphatase family protein [Bacteroidota bacterium]
MDKCIFVLIPFIRMHIRKTTCLLLLLLLIATVNGYSQQGPDSPTIGVMTYNIRYNDGSVGMFSWENRKVLLLKLIKDEKPALLGMQEVVKEQLDYLSKELPAYKSFGVGREDGKQAGEYAPVFYDSNRFQIMDSGYFWLSATPGIPKLGWNASCIRIVTWVKLSDKLSGKQCWFFNTHFDHVGQRARRKSAVLLLHKISEICGESDVIVTGDFNLSSKNIVYRRLTNKINGLADTKKISETGHSGPNGSFVGFPYMTRKHSDIDMILIRRGSARVLNHKTIDYEHSGTYPSDHLPVITTILFSK